MTLLLDTEVDCLFFYYTFFPKLNDHIFAGSSSTQIHKQKNLRGIPAWQSIMGILGLTQYVKDNFRDWEDILLSGQPLVLDGNGLRYYLSEKTDLQWEYGGQYQTMRGVMVRFIDSLLGVNIQPLHIVYDGIGHKEEKNENITKKTDI